MTTVIMCIDVVARVIKRLCEARITSRMFGKPMADMHDSLWGVLHSGQRLTVWQFGSV
jgi:hypothetical protein